MLKTKSRLPLASGLFGKLAQLKGKNAPHAEDELPDIEAFEANYAREMMERSGIFGAKKASKDDTAV